MPSFRRWKRSRPCRGWRSGCMVKVNGCAGGLVLYEPGNATPQVLIRAGVTLGRQPVKIAMNEKRRIHISKFMSKYLRHEPNALDLCSNRAVGPSRRLLSLRARLRFHAQRTRRGRASMQQAAVRNRRHRHPNSSQPRALTEVDLQLRPRNRPELFHGTAHRNSRPHSPRRPPEDGPSPRPPLPGHYYRCEGRRPARQARASGRECGKDAGRWLPLLLLRQRRVACRTRSSAVPSGSGLGELTCFHTFSTRANPQGIVSAMT